MGLLCIGQCSVDDHTVYHSENKKRQLRDEVDFYTIRITAVISNKSILEWKLIIKLKKAEFVYRRIPF